MKMSHFLLVCTAAGLVVTALRAEETSCGVGDAEFRQLEHDIPCLYLLNGLFLTPEQNDRLADLLEEQIDVEQKCAEKIERFERYNKKELERDLERDIENPSRWNRRGRDSIARRRERQLQDKAREVHNIMHEQHKQQKKLATEALDLLTDSQRGVLRGFEPCFIPSRDFKDPVRVGQAAGDTSFGEHVFDKLREAPQHELAQLREHALDEITGFIMHKDHMKYSKEAAQEICSEIAAKLDKWLPKVRTMSDVDYELEKANVVRAVMPLQHDQLNAVEEQRDMLFKIQGFVLNPGTLDVVRERGAKKLSTASRNEERHISIKKRSCDSLKALQEKRMALDMISGMRLTAAQVEKLIPIVEEAVYARQQFDEKVEETRKAALVPFQTLRNELERQDPTEKTEHKANHYHHVFMKLYDDVRVQRMKEYEQRMDHVLTADQVQFLMVFGSGKPESIRQASQQIETERTKAKNMVAKVRQTGRWEFERKKEELGQDWVSKQMNARQREHADVSREKDRAIDVMADIRDMRSSDYQKARDDLAVDLCPRYTDARPTSYGQKYHHGKPLAVLDYSTEILFSESALTMLRNMRK